MAHWVGNTKDYNGFVRQARACLLDAPRVARSATKDLAISGYVYNDISDVARGQSDIGFAIAETLCQLGVYRATCLVAGGTSAWAAGVNLTVTFTAGAGGTIQLDDNSDWTATHGFNVGDLMRIENAVDDANNNLFRISAIANNNATNDLLTVDATEDTLAAETSDTITAYSIGSGAIFEMERDTTGNGTVDTHVGWLASNVEAYSKIFDIWYTLNRGNADWVVGDYWEFTLEEGPMTRIENRVVDVIGVVISGTNVMTLSAKDQANGVTWASLGFTDENRIDIIVSDGTDTGKYRIDAITDSALTLLTLAGAAPALTNETVTIQAIPKFEVSSDPVLNVVPTDPTITRDDVGGDWLADGFLVGGHIELENSVSNNGYWRIKTLTATVMTIDDSINGNVMVTETLPATITATPRNGSLQTWTEHRYRLATSGTSPNSANDAISSSGVANGRLIRPTSDGNFVSEWIGIGPGIDSINNPKTVYIGMQSQYTGSTKQNIEHRNFDVVSDTSFGLMLAGLPDVRGYTFLSVASTIETFLEFDGDHITGFSDVNTATTTWFYQGYTAVHGTENQIPVPMFLGTSGIRSTDTRDTAVGTLIDFFFDGVSQSSTTGYQEDPQYSTAWFRWLDGQWFNCTPRQMNSTGTANIAAGEVIKMRIAPWESGLASQCNSNGDFFGGSGERASSTVLGRTPASFDATDRHYVMLPCTLWMNVPTPNVIADLKGVKFIAGVGGLATKDRQVRGSRVFYMGQNHKGTGVTDFAALELT